jgi:RimJ/RimL family protein N-acetyltransferase
VNARPAPTLKTARLLLRGWRDADRAPFAALNADPRVMRYLGPPLSRAASDALADRIAAHFAEHGFGLWALEIPGHADLIGFVGLSVIRFTPPWRRAVKVQAPRLGETGSDPVSPSLREGVEVGWRLAADAWGYGYATEAARAALAFGFEQIGLAEIVSFTTRANRASRAVMERLGMTHDPRDDFDHPLLAPGDPLRPHVLYRVRP